MPPMKGRRGSGMVTEPSSCWLFSRIAIIIRGTAHAVAFKVCTNRGGGDKVFAFLPFWGGCTGAAGAAAAGRYRIFSLRLW